MWFGFKVTKITSADIGRAIVFVDKFLNDHSRLIPVHVQTAWTAFRGALIKWKDDAAAQEGK
jgi:hypothetical protein